MSSRWLLAGAALVVLAGCSQEVRRLDFSSQTLVRPAQPQQLACPLRLVEVLDQRPDKDTGGLGRNQLVVEDPPTLVRDQLIAVGMLPAEASSGVAVSVRLKQMYLHQANMTKNPVVVYEATVDGGAPFLVRAQPSIGNWNSSRNEAVSAFSRALREANLQLFAELNRRCPTS